MVEIPTFTHAEDEDEACLDVPGAEPLCIDLARYREQKARYDRRVARLAAMLAAGEITLEVWRRMMRSEIRVLYAITHTIGIGGIGNINEQNAANLRQFIERQYAYLDAWASEMAAQMMSEPAMIARALLYGTASNAVLQQAVVGMLGMPTLPAYPGDGTSLCRVNCRCYWRIIPLGGNNFDCVWSTRPAEHCTTCLSRAALWNPLRIRNGRIEPFAQIASLFVT